MAISLFNSFLLFLISFLLTLFPLTNNCLANDLSNIRFVQVVGGEAHTCALTTNSELYCWGANYYGQLGDGTTEDKSEPVKILDNVRKVSAHTSQTCAIKNDNKLYCWGKGNDSYVPEEIRSDVKDVFLGAFHTCITKNNNRLYCWGEDKWHQLGPIYDASIDEEARMFDVKDAGLSMYYTCSVKNDSSLYCVGGVLKDYDYYNDVDLTPTTPLLITQDVKNVRAGSEHFCAIKNDNKLYCWGDNSAGQVGNGSTYTSDDLYEILSNVNEVSLGSGHTCAIKDNDKLYCWGANGSGQLGTGDTVYKLTPMGISRGIKSVGLGSYHTCAITNDGRLYCWGENDYGQIGNGVPDKNVLIPYEVFSFDNSKDTDNDGTIDIDDGCPLDPNKTSTGVCGCGNEDILHCGLDLFNNEKVVQVAGGYSHTCVVTDASKLYCWGSNSSGQLGDGTATKQMIPVEVLNNVKKVSLGDSNTCAVTNDSKLYCWGSNFYGQLGYDTSVKNVYYPVELLNDIRDVDIGSGHICAISNINRLYCWGWNVAGQLGSYNDFSVDEDGETYFTKEVSLGDMHTCSLTYGGDLTCWGVNYKGQLGNGKADSGTSYNTGGIPDARKVSVGGYFSCGITNDDNLYCWGSNSDGQLNNDYYYLGRSKSPVKILSDVKDVSTGYAHTCAITNDNTLYCWGDIYNIFPTEMLSNVKEVTSGSYHACAITYDDKLYCWGQNGNGALGTGVPTENILTPYEVYGGPRNCSSEICNGLDDDCDGIVDNGFNVGESCSNSDGKGVIECKNELETYCKITENYPPTPTPTPEPIDPPSPSPSDVTPTPTPTPTPVVEPFNKEKVVTPNSVLKAPNLITKVKKKASFEFEDFDRASVKSGESENLKYQYVMEVKKTKRNGVDKNYKLKKAVTKLLDKNIVRVTKLDKGTYYIRYRVRILQGKKYKQTKWSTKLKFTI